MIHQSGCEETASTSHVELCPTTIDLHPTLLLASDSPADIDIFFLLLYKFFALNV